MSRNADPVDEGLPRRFRGVVETGSDDQVTQASFECNATPQVAKSSGVEFWAGDVTFILLDDRGRPTKTKLPRRRFSLSVPLGATLEAWEKAAKKDICDAAVCWTPLSHGGFDGRIIEWEPMD